jgi:acetolactate synthase-1/2/3 large subunit
VERPAEVDAAISEMLAVDRVAILDVVVDPAENCFPMIPSGAAHNEMLLGPDDEAEKPVSEEGMVLV